MTVTAKKYYISCLEGLCGSHHLKSRLSLLLTTSGLKLVVVEATCAH